MASKKIDPIDEEDETDDVTARQMAEANIKDSLIKYAKELYEFMTYENIKETTRWFLDSAAIEFSFSFDDLMMLMTLFVLFGNEIRVLAVDQKYDQGFIDVTTICFAFFVAELVLVTWSKTYRYHFLPWECEGYFLSFFWWLDLAAVVSMFPEVPAISQALMIDFVNSNSENETTLKTARVVRMVRLVRLVKIYKIQAERRRATRLEAELLDLVRQGAVSYDDIATQRALYQQRQSKVGGLLSDSITRRVITIVLVMLFVVPFLQFAIIDEERVASVKSLAYFANSPIDATRYVAMDAFRKHAPELIEVKVFVGDPDDEVFATAAFNFNTSSTNLTAIGATTDYTYAWYSEDKKKSRRSGDLPHRPSELKYLSETYDDYTVKAVFDLYPEEETKATNQIMLIIFVSIMLVAGSVVFTNDAQRLVLDPIERMMNMVEAVSKDPLQPLQFQHGSGQGEYETMLLESTIEKITGLLRVGFGEAGAGIIKANLDIADNSSVINPLIPGVRIYAIFGFCDIHHFDDVNQYMGQDVLTFVNTIAEIVHSSVHDWGGQSNKNLGNAFLMIWRIGDEKTILKLTSGEAEQGLRLKDLINPNKKPLKKVTRVVDLRRVPGIDRLADKALIGYLKIIAELNRSKPILAFRDDPRLTQGGKEEFKVRMGFGLHAGWAIEGAVGSVQKVDATYLSPHVNMSARLETSSKQFGCPLLFSQALYDLMSPEVQDVCRRLDVVTVKGSEQPIGVFTYDARQDQRFRPKPILKNKSMSFGPNAGPNANANPKGKDNKKPYGGQVAPHNSGGKGQRLSVTSAASKPSAHANEHHDFSYYQSQSDADLQFMSPENDTSDVMELDVDLVMLRRHISAEFIETHKRAVDAYLAGEWGTAKVDFEFCDNWMRTNVEGFDGDGPSRVILNYMANRDNTAPKDWKGYRPLTSK